MIVFVINMTEVHDDAKESIGLAYTTGLTVSCCIKINAYFIE